MIELSFYIAPEDQARLQALLEKMNISDREFLYRALMRYIGIKEKEFSSSATGDTSRG